MFEGTRVLTVTIDEILVASRGRCGVARCYGSERNVFASKPCTIVPKLKALRAIFTLTVVPGATPPRAILT